MRYMFGTIFFLLSVWQFWMTKRSFTYLKQNGNKNTSPFVMFGQWSSLAMAIIFLVASVSCFFVDYSNFI